MLTILVSIALGVLFTSIALQNPGSVNFNFFGVILNLPIYIFSLASLLVGIMIAMVYHIFDMAGTASFLNKKDAQLRDLSKSNQSLAQQAESLANENARLRDELNSVHAQTRRENWEAAKQNVRSFFDRFRRTHPTVTQT